MTNKSYLFIPIALLFSVSFLAAGARAAVLRSVASPTPAPAIIKAVTGRSPVFIPATPDSTPGNPTSVTVEGTAPYYGLKKTTSSQQWQVNIGGTDPFSNAFTVFDQTNNRSALVIGTSGNMSLGTTVINPNSRFYVYGGPTGANIDVRGDSSIVGGDQATIELEGSDYDTQPNSALLQYYGSHALGSTMGFPNNRLGVVSFTSASVGIIRTAGTAAPLVFGTNDTERIRINGNGNVGIGTTNPQSKLHISAGANATTTVTIGELNVTSSKGCVNMNRSDGGPASFYISPAGTIVVSTSYCK